MFHACATRFDVTGNLENFLFLGELVKPSSPRRFLVTVRREGDAARYIALRCQIESAPSPSPPQRAQSLRRERRRPHTRHGLGGPTGRSRT